MEKYSGSYGGTKENFVILNNPDTPSVKFKNSREYALFCVVQNILLRGCPATKPSEYIEKEVGIVSEPPLKLTGKVPAVWSKTIKGDENNADYPARLFFDDRLSRHMGAFSFIRELALPEAEIDEILILFVLHYILAFLFQIPFFGISMIWIALVVGVLMLFLMGILGGRDLVNMTKAAKARKQSLAK